MYKSQWETRSKYLVLCYKYYAFSAFFKCNNKYVYFKISDVRYFKNEWFNHILIRTTKSEKDYTGGQNHYTNLMDLPVKLQTLFIGV